MKKHLTSVICVLGLALLAGRDNAKSPNAVANDVAASQQKAATDVADAQKDAATDNAAASDRGND